jgi:PAS domain S-box-containing protein
MPSSPRRQTTTPRKAQARHLLVPLAILAAIVLSHPTVAAPTKGARRILILNEVNPSYPATSIISQGIQTALAKSPYHLEFYSEYFDTSLFPDPTVQQEFRDFYIRKYQNRQPDVIITVGLSPLKFMTDVHRRAFPGVPIIFCLPIGHAPDNQALDSDFTGVESDMAAAETLKIALRLQPGTQHVVMVGGVSDWDKQSEALATEQIKGLSGHPEITFMTDLAVPELLERLRHLPRHTLVLLISLGKDAEGTHFKSNEISPLVAAAANAPVFSLYDVFLNHGEVGGYLSNLGEQGKVAGGMALRILRGAKPHEIPMVKGVNTYMFDWRAVKRWDLKASEIPIGSIVLNHEPTVWELYKSYIFAGIVLILLQALLIVGLLRQRISRRKAEIELGISNDRLRLAVEAGKCVGWDWDKNTGRNHFFGDLQTVFGIESDTYAGQAEDFRRLVYPEDLELVQQAVMDSERDRKPHDVEFRVVRTDGAVHWVTARGKFDYARNGDVRMLGIAADVTDRKKAEHNLHESEERFRLVANTAPVMIWMLDIGMVFNYFNQPWLEFTGCSTDAELGKVWTEIVHPEDREACLNMHRTAFLRREPFQMEYRVRRYDGEYHWILDHGVPRFDSKGTFAGYIGSCIDVTSSKMAEDALATVGRRLIEAHEEERTWIARELHDDIIQRLAVLAYELDQWGTESSLPPPGRLRDLQEQLAGISADTQTLSHRLHSSRLEFLGLAVAARSYCQELTEKAKVEIDFNSANMPSTLPKEVSLCLFRVMQEALQNAVKHSGVLTFKVELSGTPDSVELKVSDSGCGFEEQDAFSRRGLGLVSMRERLQMVHGELKVQSKPRAGTTIYGRVPLKAREYRETAGSGDQIQILDEFLAEWLWPSDKSETKDPFTDSSMPFGRTPDRG